MDALHELDVVTLNDGRQAAILDVKHDAEGPAYMVEFKDEEMDFFPYIRERDIKSIDWRIADDRAKKVAEQKELCGKKPKLYPLLYDKVLLRTGETASIVNIFEPGKLYDANIDKKDGNTETNAVKQNDIVKVVA